MKITVLGGGNAGCFTALYFAWESRNRSDVTVELRHDPLVPPEPVGQASLLSAPHILWAALGFNWHNNPIHATMKSGILYENWGRKNKHIFSTFPAHNMGMHYSTVHLQDYILKSGWFNVIEDSVLNPDDIDIVVDNVSLLWGFPVSLIEDEDQRQTLSISDRRLFI